MNETEKQRSKDLTQVVIQFRSDLLKHLGNTAKIFIDNIGIAYTSYMSVLDNSVCLDVILIPPDTEIPKKRMTLKKLRKAERIKDAVAAGREDTSKSRVWPGIDGTKFTKVLRDIDDLIIKSSTEVTDTPVVVASAPAAKGKPAKGGKNDESVMNAPAEKNPNSIVTDTWIRELFEKTSKRGLVSSAHRLLISERDAAIDVYFETLDGIFKEIRLKYDTILQQENSWSDRWMRQVELLRKGVS